MGSSLSERIVLIGYRGSGKTSVGRALADVLSWRFLDIDEEIERHEGLSIARIVALHGWEGFRAKERIIIENLRSESSCVIAPGGGAVLDAGNVANLRRGSRVFWLRADASTLLERTRGDPLNHLRRPSLTGLEPEEEVRILLEEREPFYRGASDWVVEKILSHFFPNGVSKVVDLER